MLGQSWSWQAATHCFSPDVSPTGMLPFLHHQIFYYTLDLQADRSPTSPRLVGGKAFVPELACRWSFFDDHRPCSPLPWELSSSVAASPCMSAVARTSATSPMGEYCHLSPTTPAFVHQVHFTPSPFAMPGLMFTTRSAPLPGRSCCSVQWTPAFLPQTCMPQGNLGGGRMALLTR